MSVFITASDDGRYLLTNAGYTAVVILMILCILVACLVSSSRQKTKISTRRLIFSAMAIALAYVTSYIKIIHMPMGGSVTLFSMFFVTMVGNWYGMRTGMAAAFSYGLLQFVAGPYILSVPQVLCDYLLAFGALGLSGLFSESRYGMIKGYLMGVTGRFVFSVLSGFVFFADYAPEGMNPLVYSVAYNAAYLYAEAGITFVILLIPAVSDALKRIKILSAEQAGQ